MTVLKMAALLLAANAAIGMIGAITSDVGPTMSSSARRGFRLSGYAVRFRSPCRHKPWRNYASVPQRERQTP